MTTPSTPTSTMKEAERLLERVVVAALAEGAHANPMGSRVYHEATFTAQTAMLAHIRSLVEAQPCAVAGPFTNEATFPTPLTNAPRTVSAVLPLKGEVPKRHSLCGKCMTPHICAEDGPGCKPVQATEGGKNNG